MKPSDILRETRKHIREHADSDPDRWFYANRFVYARLQLDERKTKTGVKKALFDANAFCHHCGKPFKTRRGVHIHRVDEERGYSDNNCALMHRECHRRHHSENPRRTTAKRDRIVTASESENRILRKVSKKYTSRKFLYWWDFTPNFVKQSKLYRGVELTKRDTGEFYSISTDTLWMFLTEDRRTSRSGGNWGVKVLCERPNELAFEPPTGSKEWLFLKILWEKR